MRVAAAVAEALKREGVECLIGYPVNPIIEAAAEADIRTVVVRQERTGLHMADAQSRLSSGKQIGVFAMQHGPGTENAFGGVAQAFSESVPLIVLPAGYRRPQIGVHPNFSALLNFRHVTKSIEQPTLPAAVPDALRRAFRQARNGRPGPALVEIPIDVLAEEVPGPLCHRAAPRLRSGPDPKVVDEVARVLVEAERPLIYAGQGVHYAEAWPQLQAFAELLEAPVATTIEGKSAFPEDHALALGCAGHSMPGPVYDFLHRADLIFGIGCSFTKTNFGARIPEGPTIVHATLDPLDIDKEVRCDHALVGDAALTLEALLAAVTERLHGHPRGRRRELAGEIAAARAAWLGEWRPKLDSDASPLSPYRVIRDLWRTVDVASTIITHDAGSPRDQLVPFWVSRSPLSYIGWGKTTQLGYGLGLAMGAKLARPDKLCVNVWGDAAIGFTGMDFETAVRERIPILSILFNNFSMAMELPVMKTATEKYRSTDISGNYAEMARAFGGYGERVSEAGQIVPAIERGIRQTREGNPALLEFLTAQEITFSIFS
ncbi:MAG: thiamine pyrophosphate-requiring protein [Candidatus Dormibacteraceae bacterium]